MSIRRRTSFAWVLLAMALGARPPLAAASRDVDPYGWQDYTRQLRQDESRRIDRMLDNTYGPNPRFSNPNLQPLANSLQNVFQSLAESRRQRAEEQAVRNQYLVELLRLRQIQADEDNRQAAEQARLNQRASWAREWTDLKAQALAGDAQAALNVARLTRNRSPRLPAGTPLGESAATPWLQLAANQGSPQGAFEYGLLLQKSDPREALRYLTLASERGWLDAIAHAAALAEEGAGPVQPSLTEARRLFQLGIARRHRPSFIGAARLLFRDPSATPADLTQAVAWLTEAGPDPQADSLLAQALFHGIRGIPVDRARALSLARRALKANPQQTAAQEVVGLAALTDPDPAGQAEGLRLVRAAAEAGSLPGCRTLAFAYQQGRYGLTASNPESRQWLERAAKLGDAESAYELARLFRAQSPTGVADAVYWYCQASNHGHTEAGYELALLWHTGREGFGEHPTESHIRARKSAEGGHPAAMELYAWQLLHALGTPRRPTQAADWMLRAAETGRASAQHRYALMCLEGVGLPKDPEAAFAWETKAANQGHAEAAAQMAFHRVTGTGCPADATQARRWARQGAEAGDVHAQRIYALMLVRGDGGPADPAAAVPWLEKARSQSDSHAALTLGELHRDGAGGLKADAARAKELFQEAQKSPDPDIAGAALDALKKLGASKPVLSLDGLLIRPQK